MGSAAIYTWNSERRVKHVVVSTGVQIEREAATEALLGVCGDGLGRSVAVLPRLFCMELS